MYEVLLTLQVVGIIMIVFEIFLVARQRSSRLQTILLMFMFFVLINVMGYTLEMCAKNADMAMQAIKVIYLGKPFIPYCMYLFIMEYCGVKVSHKVKNILLFICAFIMILVLSSDYNTLFYTSVDFVEGGLFPHVVLGHGIFYNIYTVFLGFYFVSALVVCISKLVRLKDNLMLRRQLIYIIFMVFIALAGLIVFMLKITGGYDSTSISYLLMAGLFVVLMRKYQLFDALSLAKEEAIDSMSNGIVVLDTEGKNTYTNNIAQDLIDYLKGEHDDVISYLRSKAKKNENIFVKEHFDMEKTHSDVEKCVYEVVDKEVKHGEIIYGHLLLITEVTDQYYYTNRLQKEVKRQTKKVVAIQRDIIGSFATMIEARDGITGLHIKNTSNYVRVLVNCMKDDERFKDIITEDYASMVADAAKLHDIGKISIPDRILQKEGKLTEEEFDIMKTHPYEGAKIIETTLKGLESNEYLDIARDMAFYHHEKFNGEGYPNKLSGFEIPLSARIMAVADVYDALRSKRHYKDGFSKEKSMQIIEENKGTHFDPVIVEIFLENIELIEEVQVRQ